MAIAHPNAPGVRFKDVPNFPGYCVGDDGSAWSRKLRSGRMAEFWTKLQANPTLNGYLTYTFSHEGKAKRFAAHRLVLELFVGPCPDGMLCRHLDNDKTNNRVANLAWGTSTENRADQFTHGTALLGETHPQAKLTDADVAAIIDRLRAGDGITEIGHAFGVTPQLIWIIGKNKTRKSVPRNGFIYQNKKRRSGAG